MGFTVEAWCRNSNPETAFNLFCAALDRAGFVGVDRLTLETSSWDCITLAQQKIFVSIRLYVEPLSITVKGRVSWEDGYSAFESLFLDLLSYDRTIQLTELLLSTRNPQCYPFFGLYPTGWFPPTIVKVDEDEVIEKSDASYWRDLGPELHFIARDICEQKQIDLVDFARSLNAGIIPLEEGAILDCGWTNEFALPQQLRSI